MSDAVIEWIIQNPYYELLHQKVQEAKPYFEDVTQDHVILVVASFIVSLISFKCARRKQDQGYLSQKLKKQLHSFEQDVVQLAGKVEAGQSRLRLIKYYKIWALLVVIAGVIYQITMYELYSSQVINSIGIAVVIILLFEIYRWTLASSIAKTSFKIQQEKNQQQQVMVQLHSEMSDKMKALLREMLSMQNVRESELEREQLSKNCEMSISRAKSDSASELDGIKKTYEQKIAAAISLKQSTMQQARSLQQQVTTVNGKCISSMCQKKKKLIKEKIKRNDWFIRNLSEFAWCNICELQIQRDPLNDKDLDLNLEQNTNTNDHSISLDDSLLQNTSLLSIPDEKEDKKKAMFENLNSENLEFNIEKDKLLNSQCEKGCLKKYFFLCKQVGEKYNKWTEVIDSFETRYKTEKSRLKKMKTI